MENFVKIVFIILHYKSLNVTKKSVEAILKNVNYQNYYILIVDNGSLDGSGRELHKIFKMYSAVKVLVSKKNLGFARGNNIGFRYAKTILKADFIVLMNNDVFIKQKNFCQVIMKMYAQKKFAVAGPDIISLKNGQHQNPVKREYYSKGDILFRIIRFGLLWLLSFFHTDQIMQKIYVKIKKNRIKKTKEPMRDYQLHGSCMIFSSQFIENYHGLCSRTFMYGEENILRFMADRDSFTMKYLPQVKVYHIEEGTTTEIFKKRVQKRRFYYRNNLKSCIVLLRLMRE